MAQVIGSHRKRVPADVSHSPRRVWPMLRSGRMEEESGGKLVRRRDVAGREFDPESGLYYMRARYYDPAMGRWIGEDPAGIEGGANLYAYAGDDPVNGRDPSGLGAYCVDAELTYDYSDWEDTPDGPRRVNHYTQWQDCYTGREGYDPSGTVSGSAYQPGSNRKGTPAAPEKEGPSCREAKLLFWGSFAVDVGFFLTGGISGTVQIFKAGGYAVKGALRALPRTGRLEYMWAVNGLSRGAQTFGKAYVGSRGVGMAGAAAVNGVGGVIEGAFSWGDVALGMLPVIGTIAAFDTMQAACSPS